MRFKNFTSIMLIVMLCSTSCSKDKKEEILPPKDQADIAKVDDQVNAFLTKYRIPGASLAISKNGKLVYRKGYGFADKEKGEKVTTNNRFRLASVSKTYTAAAIMKLIEQGKLTLNDKIFGTGFILGTKYGTLPYSDNVSKITVKNLLNHTTGGWGGSSGGDPIDQNPAMNNDDFLNWVLKNKPVMYSPGTRYDYSNMGYFIAGRVIEKISGKPYSTFIKEMVSAFGDTNTDISGPLLSDRKPNEVKYYSEGTDLGWEYKIALSRRDADGGLMTTATDLLRFVTAIDGVNTRPDILNSNSLTLMSTPSGPAPLSPYYGLGMVAGGNVWGNDGSLPGTRTSWKKSTSGICISLLLNSRQDNNPSFQFASAIEGLVVSILQDNSISWQSIDQF